MYCFDKKKESLEITREILDQQFFQEIADIELTNNSDIVFELRLAQKNSKMGVDKTLSQLKYDIINNNPSIDNLEYFDNNYWKFNPVHSDDFINDL